MYAEERQQAITRLIRGRGRVAVTELAEEFTVTTETVRRDLSLLERAGLVRRVHGGAVPAGSIDVIEQAISERDEANTAEKEQIARAAVALLPPDDGTILLDAGTTTARLADLLPRDRRLVAITHAVPIAARLAGLANIDLRLLPGRVRPTTQAAVGADMVAALDLLRADVAFLGTNAVSLEHGCSTPDNEEAAAKRAMARAGKRVVVLTDSSKLDQDAAVRFAALDEVDVLVTDSGASHEQRRRIAAAGPEVVVA